MAVEAQQDRIDIADPKVRERLRLLARDYFQTEIEKRNEEIANYKAFDEWEPETLAADTAAMIDQRLTELKYEKSPCPHRCRSSRDAGTGQTPHP